MTLKENHTTHDLVQEIQFWEFMGGSNFAQATIILGCSNRAIPCRNEGYQLSQSVYLHVATKGGQLQLSHHCSALAFVSLFVAAAAAVHHESHFLGTEGQELFAFPLDPPKFSCLNALRRMI